MKTPEFLRDIDGHGSSKRVGAFWALGLFSLLVFAEIVVDIQTGRSPAAYIVDAVMYIVLGGFLTSTAERVRALRPGTPPAPPSP